MKILFLIFNIDYGQGGHFHSLLETAKQLKINNDIKVISFGVHSSPVLLSLKEDYKHITYPRFLNTLKKLFHEINIDRPEVINCFDAQSYMFGRIASFYFNIPIVLTKCGGPNPLKYYPFAEDLVLYSIENKNFFKESKKFKVNRLSLIANRVAKASLKQDAIRSAELTKLVENSSYKILRINRFSVAYKKTMIQSIELVNKLTSMGVCTSLVIIGVVQDQEVYDEIQNNKPDNVYLITDDYFTNSASELINAFDMVIGTGRSLMEAALIGKKVLVPTSNLNIPVLINKENFYNAFEYNFSPRYTPQTDENEEIEKILKSTKSEIVEMAEKYFLSELIGAKYLKVYSRSVKAKFILTDWIKNYILLLRYSNASLREFFNKRFGR